MRSQIDLTEEQMEEKINTYISQQLQTKESQYQKWKKELEDLMFKKVHIDKIHIHIEQGKLSRYDMPEFLKQSFDKVNKFSKELRKIMMEKTSFERLEQLESIADKEH